MRFFRIFLLGFITGIVFILTPARANASEPKLESAKFGYGAHLNIFGAQVEKSILAAGSLDLDWISIDLDWSRLWGHPDRQPDWSQFDAVVALAHENDLAVMVVITNPPAWAMGADGPDIDLCVSLIQELTRRYAGSVFAAEIFPGMNTSQGWGGQPNPRVYANLLKSIHPILKRAQITLVTGGLTPTQNSNATDDLDPCDYLSALYQEGISDIMEVVGLQLQHIGANPISPSDNAHEPTLRYYETIRTLMLAHNHTNPIWITGFSWATTDHHSEDQQATWAKQAFLLMRGQLYIGVAFLYDLNASETELSYPALIDEDAKLHPALNAIGQIISLEKSQQTIQFDYSLNQRFKNHSLKKVEIQN